MIKFLPLKRLTILTISRPLKTRMLYCKKEVMNIFGIYRMYYYDCSVSQMIYKTDLKSNFLSRESFYMDFC